ALLLASRPRWAFRLAAWRIGPAPPSGPGRPPWAGVGGRVPLPPSGMNCPTAPFPEALAAGPVFEATARGPHRLPRARCVGNDLSLGDGGPHVLIVSGSNMAGKSTLLRAAGVNAALALAGAPVRARRLRLAPLAVGATLRIQDSLLGGRSRFHAEVLCVRRLLEMA